MLSVIHGPKSREQKNENTKVKEDFDSIDFFIYFFSV